MFNRVLGYAAVGCAMLGCLYVMVQTYYDLQTAVQRGNPGTSPLIRMTLSAVGIGILLEAERIVSLFRRGPEFNWLLIPTLITGIFVFVPRGNWLAWFDADRPFYADMFFLPETHAVLSVAAGVLLIKGLTGRKRES
ncbi:hypothetical protein [Salibacterium qingdaonense]|uniref:Uncharacterized protein n=1 Tax=Salibacterium qingdaonense TaxID=266892 RepID=A0A1I4NRP7_9BACI|nr:hypothetical protein [Salibacterium qingdaonense]SFM18119.1 hypothetical protein SAMN04488054_1206 [Salibacterium qingdaonense]